MVSIDRIVEVTKKNNRYIGQDLDYLTSVYETGMLEILRELAEMKLLKVSHRSFVNERFENANNEAIKAYDDLYQCLNENQREMLMDLEAAYNYVSSCECEERFIQGFIMGYKFIKELKTSYRPL